MFLKNKNIIFKIRRSKVTDYAALSNIFCYSDFYIVHGNSEKISTTELQYEPPLQLSIEPVHEISHNVVF